jgi:hypothetical protein
MSDLLSRLSSADLVGLSTLVLLFGGGTLIALVLGVLGILMSSRRRLRQLELEMTLKQEMVRKGMSAEDIERVMRAGPGGPQTAAGAPPAAEPPVNELAQHELDARLAAHLAGAGMEGAQLQEAVAAVAAAPLDTKRSVYQAVVAMVEEGVDPEQMHAAVLGLCQAAPQGITKLKLG